MSSGIGDIEVTEEYWDCECEKDYIHPASQNLCTVCGAVQEDQPGSRVSEVKIVSSPKLSGWTETDG